MDSESQKGHRAVVEALNLMETMKKLRPREAELLSQDQTAKGGLELISTSGPFPSLDVLAG